MTTLSEHVDWLLSINISTVAGAVIYTVNAAKEG
jgi:hypothetical protein